MIGGFRYESKRRLVGSLLLGLYNSESKLDHVGFTTTIADKERTALTKLLERIREPPASPGRRPEVRAGGARSGQENGCR